MAASKGPTGILFQPWDADIQRTAQLAARTGVDELMPPSGMFAEVPSATPKWTGRGVAAEADFRQTMARMFIQLNASEVKRFLTSVAYAAKDHGESAQLAAVLAGAGTSDRGTGYIDFLLQNVQMPFQEKAQVVETLADNFVIYYFGAAAVPWTFSGTCFNTYEDDQGINMLRMYRDMLRGTQLAKRRKLLRVRFNNMIVAGSVMGLTLGLEADTEVTMPFSFQLMPKSVTLLPNDIFGLVVLPDPASDPSYQATTEAPTGVTTARPLAAPGTTLAGAAALSDVGEENEAQQSLASSATTGQSVETEDQSVEPPTPVPG